MSETEAAPSSTHRSQGQDLQEGLDRLRSLLRDADTLATLLESLAHRQRGPSGPGATDETARKELQRLQHDLEQTKHDQEELTEQLVEAERQAGKLTSLYVATYQLHASLDPGEVQNSIAEITRDLVGAESFALLIKDEVEGGCEIALGHNVPQDGLFAGDTYRGGDPLVDATLEDGVVRLDGKPGVSALAAVPLRVEDAIVGALVILKMLDHKTSPLSDDRDILDLLAAHAASALFAARVYSRTDRKLRTLESLVNLIRGT